jgi:hypothetical protein
MKRRGLLVAVLLAVMGYFGYKSIKDWDKQWGQ